MRDRRIDAHRRRRDLKEQAVRYKGGRCEICGYDRCVMAFDFHHVNPLEKDFTISSGTSWARIQKELDKCVLLCSRCHREVHDGLHHGYLTDEVSERFSGEHFEAYDDEDTIPPELQ